MRTFTRSAYARRLAVLVCVSLLWQLLLVIPLSAQIVAPQPAPITKPPTAVVDFKVAEQIKAGMLSRRAADAVALALSQARTGYTPLSRQQVDQQLKLMGLTAPLSTDAQQQLGDALDVKWVISGEVRSVKVSGGQATVVLAVSVVGVAAADTISGAVVEGRSQRKPGYRGDEDVLIDEALSNAAYQAAVQLGATAKVVESVILIVGDNLVQIRDGLPSGIRPGMRMAVLRLIDGRFQRIGTVKVRSSGSHDAVGDVIESRLGIQSGDHLQALFDLPAAKPGTGLAPATPRKHASFTEGLTPLLAVAAIALAISGGKGHGGGSTSSGSTAAPTACASSGGDANLVSWAGGIDSGTIRTKATEVWRESAAGRVLIGVMRPGDGNSLTDGPATPAGQPALQSPPPGHLTLTVDDPLVDDVTEEFEPTADEALGPNVAPDSYEAAWVPPSAIDGTKYTYRIRRIVLALVPDYSQTPAPGQPQPTKWILRYETGLSGRSGSATPLAKPVAVTPGNGDTGVNRFSNDFVFQGTTGANEYIIQISRTAQFLPTQSAFFPTTGPIRTILTTGDTYTQIGVDFSSLLDLSEGEIGIFWRVGARDATNSVKPRSPEGNTSDNGWVWSDPFGFTTAAPL